MNTLKLVAKLKEDENSLHDLQHHIRNIPWLNANSPTILYHCDRIEA